MITEYRFRRNSQVVAIFLVLIFFGVLIFQVVNIVRVLTAENGSQGTQVAFAMLIAVAALIPLLLIIIVIPRLTKPTLRTTPHELQWRGSFAKKRIAWPAITDIVGMASGREMRVTTADFESFRIAIGALDPSGESVLRDVRAVWTARRGSQTANPPQ